MEMLSLYLFICSCSGKGMECSSTTYTYFILSWFILKKSQNPSFLLKLVIGYVFIYLFILDCIWYHVIYIYLVMEMHLQSTDH